MDTSVLLRFVLGQPDRLAEWKRIETAVTSALTAVECLRTLDRRHRQGKLEEDELVERRALALKLLERMEKVNVTPAVLRRASEPFPTPLGTLDGLHLASALLWKQANGPLVLATHDDQLRAAARSVGFDCVG